MKESKWKGGMIERTKIKMDFMGYVMYYRQLVLCTYLNLYKRYIVYKKKVYVCMQVVVCVKVS